MNPTHLPRLLALAASLSLALVGPALAQDAKLPGSLTATAYDTGSSGFNIAVALGKMLKQREGTDLRVLPGGNDIARLAPLKAGRAQFSAMGVGSYFAQEGVFEFGSKDWGPQQVQLMLASTSCNGLSLGVAKDTGVKDIKDLKGKRVGFVVGAPALNQNALAVLAYGGLTQADVKIVEFSSYGAMWKGLVNNETDAAFASTISGQAREVDSSPRGLVWPPAPAGDKAAWTRVNKVGPYFYPHKAECGAAHQQGQPGGAARLSLPDLHGLRQPTDRAGPWPDQRHDQALRRLQGRRAGRRRPGAQATKPQLGIALPRRCGARR